MQIDFIMVEPAVPENVGAAARAIKTMGFTQLVLINPCNHLSDPARWLAHASNEILESAKLFNRLSEAVSQYDLLIGTTAKQRSVKHDYLPLPQLPELIAEKRNTIQRIAIIFGREESGLTNEELKLCDLVTTVPLKTSYPSLNLAQSVMLYAYELSRLSYPTKTNEGSINKNSFKILKQKVEQLLLAIGFKPESNIYPRFFERLNFLKEDDIHLLHSVCSKLISKIPIENNNQSET